MKTVRRMLVVAALAVAALSTVLSNGINSRITQAAALIPKR